MEPIKQEKFKQLLLERRKTHKEYRSRLWGTICQSNEGDGDLSRYPFHMADEGTDSMENEQRYQFLQREDHYLQKIDEALEKIKQGDYGICRICGKEICEERLKAVPTTQKCLTCKISEKPSNHH